MATNAPQQNQIGHDGRGIRNVQVNPRVSTSDERFNEQVGGRLTRAQFIKGGNTRQGRFAANDPIYEGGEQTGSDVSGSMPSTAQALQQRTSALRNRSASFANPITKAVKKRAIFAVQPYVFWIACISYIFQGLFGLLSLFAFFGGSTIDSSFLTSWINTFIDASNGLEAVGNLLWGISALIACGTFFAFLLLYKILGRNPFHSIMSTFITILVLSLSILPIMNLAPWIVLWVIYLSADAIFSKK